MTLANDFKKLSRKFERGYMTPCFQMRFGLLLRRFSLVSTELDDISTIFNLVLLETV